MMIKNIKYILWFTFMFLSLGWFLPIRTYALTTETIYANENNCSLSDSGKYKNVSSNGTISTNSINTTYQGKSYGMSFFFAEDMLTTKIYQLKITFMADDLLSRVTSNFISITTYDTSCEQDYATILSIEKNTNSGNATTLIINFIPTMTSNKANILIGSPSGPTQITGETNFGIKKVEIGDRESQGNEDIIINNNQNTQNVINNNNQNTQNLIDNQNAIAEQQEEQQKVCTNIDKNNIEIDNKYLDSNGNQQPSNNYGITEYIKIDSESKIKVLTSLNSESAKYCFYTSSKDLISCHTISNSLVDTELTIPSNADYLRSSIQKVQNKPTYEICKNGNQAISDNLNELNNNLTNDSPVDLSSLNGTAGWLPPGPVDSIINLPLTMLQNIYNSLSTACFPLIINLPYTHQTVTIPCLSAIFGQIEGLTTFWAWVGTIASVVILYSYLINLYNYYDRLTTLQANYLDDFGGTP